MTGFLGTRVCSQHDFFQPVHPVHWMLWTDQERLWLWLQERTRDQVPPEAHIPPPQVLPCQGGGALEWRGKVRARPAGLFHCTHQPYHTNRHHVKDWLQPVLLFTELVQHHSLQSIVLAKIFVWVLLWDIMEKVEWTFWWIQYFLPVPWSYAWSSSHSLCYCFLLTSPRSFFEITLHVWVGSTQFGVRGNTESEVRWPGFVTWPLRLLTVWPWESSLTSLSFSFLLCKTRSLHIPILWVLWGKNQDIHAKFPAYISVVDTWIC